MQYPRARQHVAVLVEPRSARPLATRCGLLRPAKIRIIGSGPGQYDGVEVLSDGRILVSSWADSAVHVLQDRTLTPFITGVAAPADFGIDTKRRVLALPRFMEGAVQFWRIP
jgi:hypothetical protein